MVVIVDGSQWQDAQEQTSQGKYDALLGILHMDARDQYAIWSQALKQITHILSKNIQQLLQEQIKMQDGG